jgi:hypothetical protein
MQGMQILLRGAKGASTIPLRGEGVIQRGQGAITQGEPQEVGEGLAGAVGGVEGRYVRRGGVKEGCRAQTERSNDACP